MPFQLHSDLLHCNVAFFVLLMPPCSSKSHCLRSAVASVQQQDTIFSLSFTLTDQGWTVCTGELETSNDQSESTLGDEQAGQGKDQADQVWNNEQAAVDGDGGGALLQASYLLSIHLMLST